MKEIFASFLCQSRQLRLMEIFVTLDSRSGESMSWPSGQVSFDKLTIWTRLLLLSQRRQWRQIERVELPVLAGASSKSLCNGQSHNNVHRLQAASQNTFQRVFNRTFFQWSNNGWWMAIWCCLCSLLCVCKSDIGFSEILVGGHGPLLYMLLLRSKNKFLVLTS